MNDFETSLREGLPLLDEPSYVPVGSPLSEIRRRHRRRRRVLPAAVAGACSVAIVGGFAARPGSTQNDVVLGGVTPTPSSCPAPLPVGNSSATYLNTLHVLAKDYIASAPDDSVQFGVQVATITCRIDETVGRPEGFRDGDAASLPVGSGVFEIVGLDPAVAVGATLDGHRYTYYSKIATSPK